MNLCRTGSVLVFILAMALASIGFCAPASTTNYVGLVYSGSANVSSKAGIFSISVSRNRNFSGQITIGRREVGFFGRFNTNGAANIVVQITTDNSCYDCDPPIIDVETQSLWNVHFQLSPDRSGISGRLHFRDGGFPDGTLSGKRSSFSHGDEVPSPGKFTFLFAGSGDPTDMDFPTGNGFGTATIRPSGIVCISGSLADKSVFSESTRLCDDGTFPVYHSLYNGKGIIQGWMGLTNSADADLTGDVLWVKPHFVQRPFYLAGFTNDVPVIGSRYVQTKPLFNWTNGVVIFQGGKLTAPFTNSVLLNAKNQVRNLSDNKLTLKIQPSVGRFSGSVKEPLTGNRISFSGVILPNANGGFGFFPEAPLIGQVLFEPAGL
jgi:hypothetical protein